MNGLIISFFLFSRTYHSLKLSEDAINDEIEKNDYTGIQTNCSKESSCCNNYYACSECCCRCYKYNSGLTCQIASTEYFVKLNGTCLCITYILLDIFHCWACVVRAENYGAEENDLWNGGGVLTFQGFVGIVLIANMMFAKVFPVFLCMIATRIIIVVTSQSDIEMAARSLNLLIVAVFSIFLWKRELRIRRNYKHRFGREKNDHYRRNLELLGTVKMQKIERQAIREAKHLISECFNTVVLAAQRLQNNLVVVENSVVPNSEKGDADLLQVNYSKEELDLCDTMIQTVSNYSFFLILNSPINPNNNMTNFVIIIIFFVLFFLLFYLYVYQKKFQGCERLHYYAKEL